MRSSPMPIARPLYCATGQPEASRMPGSASPHSRISTHSSPTRARTSCPSTVYGCDCGHDSIATPGNIAAATVSIMVRRSGADMDPRTIAPEVELLRFADVQSIDRVAPIGQPGTGDENVVVARRRDHAQRPWNHRCRLCTQQQLHRRDSACSAHHATRRVRGSSDHRSCRSSPRRAAPGRPAPDNPRRRAAPRWPAGRVTASHAVPGPHR